MTANEIRARSDEELQGEIQDLKENLFNLKFRSRLAQIEDHSQIKKVRRDIARIKTVLRERALLRPLV